MTREELIEVMARAIHDDWNKGDDWKRAGDTVRLRFVRDARAALAALEAAGVRLVPVDMSRHMLLAAHTVESDDIAMTEDEHRAMYAAFVAASPYAPPGG